MTASTCRSCGAGVAFARTANGNTAPFQPDPAGEWALDDAGVMRHVGKASTQLELGVQPRARWTSHFATCPQAEQWRKR